MYYIKYLDMFRAIICSSSGGQNCIFTASGIVTPCERLCSALVERDEVTGEWRKLHNEELNDLYSLPNIVRVVKSRRMRWAGHVWGRGQVCTGFWWGSWREGDHWEDPDVDGRIILRGIFRK
jgi:hypothetical protein